MKPKSKFSQSSLARARRALMAHRLLVTGKKLVNKARLSLEGYINTMETTAVSVTGMFTRALSTRGTIHKHRVENKRRDHTLIAADLETYLNHDGQTEIYAAAWYSRNSSGGVIKRVYWITDYVNAGTLLKTFFEDIANYSIISGKQSTVYFHNNSGFDALLYLSELSAHFTIKPLIHNQNIISIRVLRDEVQLFDIRDSMLILPQSLSALCKAFNVVTPKGASPHRWFDLRKHDSLTAMLSYSGDKLPYEYYIPKRVTPAEWETLPARYNLRLDEELYVMTDCIALHQVMTAFFDEVWSSFKVSSTYISTIAGLALRIWKTHYLPKGVKIFNLTESSDVLMREAFTGGYTETMRPQIGKGYHYDVKSMYPSVMKEKMPVGVPALIPGSDLGKGNDCLTGFFGFIACTVRTPTDMYMPLLGVRRDGHLLHPLGVFSGIWFSEELRVAVEEGGYTIESVHFGVSYEKGDIFNEYVDKIYAIKATEDVKKRSGEDFSPARREVSKLLLNSLFGRLGLKPKVTHTEIIKEGDTASWGAMDEIFSIFDLKEGQLVTFTKHDETQAVRVDTNCSISAAITGYAHVVLWRYMNAVGQRVWMCDTDSIISDEPLPAELCGHEIGQMELEHELREGYFLSPKVYAEVTSDGSVLKKSKGCDSRMLELEDYKVLINPDLAKVLDVERFFRLQDRGTIEIRLMPFTLRSTITKRIRVFVDGDWVDTIPFILREGPGKVEFLTSLTGMPAIQGKTR